MASDEIWVGTADVKPLDESDPRYEGVTMMIVVLYTLADSREEFDAVLKDVLEEDGLVLVDAKQPGPLHEIWGIDQDALELALATARSGLPTPSYITVVPDGEDEEDEDVALLRTAYKNGDAVDFRVLASDRQVFGFVVAMTEAWVLVHCVSPIMVAFDGHMAIRLDEVAEAEIVSYFVTRTLEQRGDLPSDPSIALEGYRSIFGAAQEHFPLVGIIESDTREGIHVGRIETFDDDKVTVLGANDAGEWGGPEQHEYEDIIGIQFGSAYLEALASFLTPDGASAQ